MVINKFSRYIPECRLCNSKEFNSFINFDSIAIGNNLQDTKLTALDADEHPLHVLRCKSCNHFQLNYAVDPNVLYATNYTYLSGIGQSFVIHINNYVDWVAKETNLSKNSIIVEIGSNDGTCLNVFKEKGYKVCGVDPAKLAADISAKKGIFTINDFFNDKVVNHIFKKFGHVDIITSQNVLAHVDDLKGTFKKIYNLLKNNGYFVFEVGYFKNVLEKNYFDTIYHEHLDYHHASPLVNHLCALGFDVANISTNEIQGGSLRILLQKTGKGIISKGAKAFIKQEMNSILYNKDLLINWSKKVFDICAEISQIVKKEKKNGLPCYAYGSPTKATLLLKMTKLSLNDINFIVEDNEHKVGKYLPKIGIPIFYVNNLDFKKSAVILILAWNFSEDIISKLKKLYKVPIKVIIPLPELKVISLC